MHEGQTTKILTPNRMTGAVELQKAIYQMRLRDRQSSVLKETRLDNFLWTWAPSASITGVCKQVTFPECPPNIS